MKKKEVQPNWWQIDLLAPLMLGLLILEKKSLALSPLDHELVQAATVFVILGLATCWLYVNRTAVRGASDQPGPWQRMVALESEENATSWPAKADKANLPEMECPIHTTAIYMQTRNGTWIRTWLN